MNSYTSALLDGEVITLEEFANVISKAFGFCSHMSEHKFTAPYKPMDIDKETEYNREQIEGLESEIEELKTSSLEDIEKRRKRELKEDITRIENYIALKKINYNRVVKLIEELESKNFPEELLPCRKYMLRELIDVRDNDCDTEVYEERLKKLEWEYSSFSVEEYIETTILYKTTKIEEYNKQIKKDTERVEKDNKIAEQFFNIFKA